MRALGHIPCLWCIWFVPLVTVIAMCPPSTVGGGAVRVVLEGFFLPLKKQECLSVLRGKLLPARDAEVCQDPGGSIMPQHRQAIKQATLFHAREGSHDLDAFIVWDGPRDSEQVEKLLGACAMSEVN